MTIVRVDSREPATIKTPCIVCRGIGRQIVGKNTVIECDTCDGVGIIEMDRIEFLESAFPSVTFNREPLKEGDYETDLVKVERKLGPDLNSSIMDGRLESQMSRLSAHPGKVVVLMCVGNWSQYKREAEARGQNINISRLYGAVASVSCRENFIIWHMDGELDALLYMVKFMSKVDEGKYQLPAKRNPDILISRLLGITVIQWHDIQRTIGSIEDVINCDMSTLTKIYGIKDKKATQIKQILTGEAW